jgi:hypothetical protein
VMGWKPPTGFWLDRAYAPEIRCARQQQGTASPEAEFLEMKANKLCDRKYDVRSEMCCGVTCFESRFTENLPMPMC